MGPKVKEREKLARHLNLIQLEPNVAEKLKEEVVGWISDATCENDRANCPGARAAENEFDRILHDSYVDHLEAPLLYDILKEVAGSDGILNSGEASRKNLRWTLASQENRTPKTNPDEELLRLFKGEVEIAVEEKNLLWAADDNPRPPILRSDEGCIATLLGYLQVADKEFEILISLLEDLEDDLIDRSTSFLNFTGIQNFFGYASYFTRDGAPLAETEIEGVKSALKYFRELSTDLKFYANQLSKDKVDLDHPDIRRFLQSPLADLAKIPHSHEEHPGKDNGSPNSIRDFSKFAGWMAGELYDADAKTTAYDFADSVASGLESQVGEPFTGEDADAMRHGVGGWFDEVYYQHFIGTVNSSSSPVSMGIVAAGGALAKLLSKIGKMASLVTSASSSMGKAKYLLPGSLLFAGRGGSVASRMGFAATGAAAECARFGLYSAAGGMVAGHSGEAFIGNAYLFFGGMISALENQAYAKLVDELANKKSGGLLDALLASGMGDAEIDDLARAMQGAAKQQKVSFSGDVAGALKRRRFEMRTTEGIAKQRMRQTFFRLRDELVPLKSKSYGLGDDFAEEVDATIALPDQAAAVAKMEGLLERARETLAKRKPPTPPSGSALPSARVKRATTPDGGTRTNGNRRVRQPTPRSSVSSTPRPAPAQAVKTPLGRALNNPPEEISAARLTEITGGKVNVESSGVKGLQKFYRENPKLRGTFWRKMDEIISSRAREMKIEKRTGELFVRVGMKYRLFFQRVEETGEFAITKIKTRGSTGWKEY